MLIYQRVPVNQSLIFERLIIETDDKNGEWGKVCDWVYYYRVVNVVINHFRLRTDVNYVQTTMCGCLWHSCQCVSHDATLRHIWLLISGRIWRISVGPSPSSLVTIFYGDPEVWISLYHWTSVAVPCCPSFEFVQKFEDHLFDSLRNHEQVNFSDPDMFWTQILHDVRRNAWNSRWTFEVLCFFSTYCCMVFIIFPS